MYRVINGYLYRWNEYFSNIESANRLKKVNLPDGYYRYHRGELVRIPEQWRGIITHRQTINKRNPVSRRTRSGP